MEKVITAAVETFKVKLIDAIYNNMVDECFIDDTDEDKTRVITLVNSAKYHSDKHKLILCTNDFLMSSITKILEHISVDLHKYIENIWFYAEPTEAYTTFNMKIELELYIPNIVELFYFEKTKLKLAQ